MEGRDIGWEQAIQLWNERGYAEAYDEVYEDGLLMNRLYPRVMERVGQR